MTKKILIIGGAGYVGTELCNSLGKKYSITCLDTFWFGNFLKKNIKIIKKDFRNIKIKELQNFETVIHLAYLSNDPLCELNARDTWETGPLAVYSLLEKCTKSNIKHFIFASSGSIYGVKKERKVTEELGLEPITDYNKSKMICEKVIESYSNKIKTTILRPATVCGFSKRLRLDVVLNLFCYQAYFQKKINILGGEQIRPILHIKDMINCYEFFIKNRITGTFNVGFENIKIIDLAKKISKITKCKIIKKKTNDPRSYRMNSEKIIKTGFKPEFNCEIAIYDILEKFKQGFKPSKVNWNLKWLLHKKIIKKI